MSVYGLSLSRLLAFSAFGLRSSVVSVLVSLISDMSPTRGQHIKQILEHNTHRIHTQTSHVLWTVYMNSIQISYLKQTGLIYESYMNDMIIACVLNRSHIET